MATVKWCDRCNSAKAIDTIQVEIGESRDAADGRMSPDYENRDLCGPCSLKVLQAVIRIMEGGKDYTFGVAKNILSKIKLKD